MINVVNVFFFKQKTAYEMRISDWSSDVCSSDLEQGGPGRRRGAAGACGDGDPRASELVRFPGRRHSDREGLGAGGAGGDQRRDRDAVDPEADGGGGQDRKSGVLGKSVSVRVDLGGRRIIKKTNTKCHITTSYNR